MREPTGTSHDARMRRAVAYIDSHLGEALTLERLSAVAAFSKFHFHRAFAAWTGQPLHRYVQAARVNLAAHLLVFRTHATIAEIAFDCGYGSPEAFARMFKRQTGQTPTAFRSMPDWRRAGLEGAAETRQRGARAFSDGEVALVGFPETRVAVLEHQGPADGMAETIRRFIAWRKAFGLAPARSATFNLFYADPATGDGFRMAVCAATRRAIPANEEGVGAAVIPAGRCARLRLTGSSAELRRAVAFLYDDWLPRSGVALRDFPLFTQRHAVFPDVPENEAVTDVFLPVR